MNRRAASPIIIIIAVLVCIVTIAGGELLRSRFGRTVEPFLQRTPTRPASTPLPIAANPTQAISVEATTQMLSTAATWSFVKTGEAAPDFILIDHAGNSIRLTDFRGNVVVINFWASWCLPCREEMSDLQAVYDEYRDRGLVVLGVNTTYLDTLEEAHAFIDALRLTFPIVFD